MQLPNEHLGERRAVAAAAGARKAKGKPASGK
jgi:hypothetical protein